MHDPPLLQRIRALLTPSPWVQVDLAEFEAMEDALDVALAQERLAEGAEPIPAAEVFRKLDWNAPECPPSNP